MASFWENFGNLFKDWKSWVIPGYAPWKMTENMFSGLSGEHAENAQREANETNIALTNATNAQAQYNMEHAHQIEVADLQAAGLNPWLSVGGGAQQANLQTAQVEAVDGSKILQATTAAALLAVIKLATKK